MEFYDTIIVGAGPGGIFTAFELLENDYKGTIAIFDKGNSLSSRKCPIDGDKIKTCIQCKNCSIMNGFGGAGAFSDGKYNITNDFGGTLYEKIGKEKAIELMKYVDEINLRFGGSGTKLYSTANSKFNRICLQNQLNLLNAEVRHLGTDKNYDILLNLYKYMYDRGVKFFFNTEIKDFEYKDDKYIIDDCLECKNLIFSVGRSGSKQMEEMCKKHNIKTLSNRVDIGVRVELDSEIFSHITDELYEGKIVYKTKNYEDSVRTFCMNPHGEVVNENTNGIITVNGHSFEDPSKHTKNTNFALLVSKHFTEPFNDSTAYAESIAKLSNMLGGGVIVQRFGDLIRGRRSTQARIDNNLVTPTLKATPGDLSLVLPKRILDGIIEMIYALDKIAPGTANDELLLYGVEVKFYNMEVDVNTNLQAVNHKNLYIIGDGSGLTHSLSQASASGVYVARNILQSN